MAEVTGIKTARSMTCFTAPLRLRARGRASGVILGVAALLLSCPAGAASAQAAGQDARQDPAPAQARSEVERGPLRVTVELEPAPARLSDDLTLTLTIECPPGVAIRKPDVPAVLPEDFLVRATRQLPPRTERDRQVLEHVYQLEPTRAGRLTIPPLGITFAGIRPAERAEETLRTEAIAVEVTSVITGPASLAGLRPLAGPLGFEEPGGRDMRWLVPAALSAVAVALAIVVLGWLLRRRPADAATALSPQREARRGLKQLLDEGWAARDVKRLYAELTVVVRRYLQRATGIPALEQTTAETLRSVAGCRVVPAETAAGLRHLLEGADMVKFAARRPAPPEIDESVRQAESIIDLKLAEADA